MQAKLMFALCVVNIFINAAAIGGCIYETKQQQRTAIHTSNKSTDNPKEQLKEQKEPLQNNTETKVEIETDEESDTQAIKPVSLGEFKLTAYCSCEICCNKWALNRPIDENGNEIVYGSIGERLKEGYSIAVDPTVISYRTEVVINGHTYRAQDCGSAIKGNRIDVYFEDHQAALDFGVQYAEVFIK